MNSVEISVGDGEPPSWLDRYRRFCLLVLERLDLNRHTLSILLTDDPGIRELNKRYRNMDAPTDVLSFRHEGVWPPGAPSEVTFMGDLVLSLDSVRRNARELGVSVEEQLKRTTIHGVLHLCGMDHDRNDPGGMITQQEELLGELKEEQVL